MTKDLSSLKLHTELYVSCKRDLIPPCVFLVPPSPLITSKAPLGPVQAASEPASPAWAGLSCDSALDQVRRDTERSLCIMGGNMEHIK